jgi:F0F1-type ATP synthase assembly protein I
MTTSQKNQMLKRNTLLWVVAMVLPGILYIALASTKFPWPVIIPFLLLGAMLASNNMLTKAMGTPTDAPSGAEHP